jgi:hypothetical protein
LLYVVSQQTRRSDVPHLTKEGVEPHPERDCAKNVPNRRIRIFELG